MSTAARLGKPIWCLHINPNWSILVDPSSLISDPLKNYNRFPQVNWALLLDPSQRRFFLSLVELLHSQISKIRWSFSFDPLINYWSTETHQNLLIAFFLLWSTQHHLNSSNTSIWSCTIIKSSRKNIKIYGPVITSWSNLLQPNRVKSIHWSFMAYQALLLKLTGSINWYLPTDHFVKWFLLQIQLMTFYCEFPWNTDSFCSNRKEKYPLRCWKNEN